MIPFDINEFCAQCNVAEPADFTSKMTRLYDLLLKTNREINLTRIQSEEDYWIKHVADSLAIARYFPQLSDKKLAVADIGCGAGFPSLVLAAAFSNLRITAIDSIGKKTAFVESAARELNLNNLEVITGRSKELNRKAEYIERFDIVTARAVSDLRTLFKEARKFIKPGGQFIFFKTPEQAEIEVPQVRRDKKKYSLTWKQKEVFSLPHDSGKRLFVYSV
ncbi:MAG: 16S rRNA (guanine(527)-N(7))-methyltransferase RsmG [Victivallaceae bacterium]|nr:16S rRNA (guanine(527)-N(7))-methyltransferase RsmG [Victivallaceae bacterium]